MRSLPAFASLLAAVHALPQKIDLEAVADADPVSSVSVPIGAAQATTIQYDPQTAYQAVTESVNEDPPTQTAAATGTGLKKRAACDPQPTGAGPIPSPDTVSAFLAYSAYASAASAAPTPSGYVNTFTNLQASNNAYGYLGYTALSSYDSNLCASKCNAIKGCSAFNLYFERDPSVEPGTGCENPDSTTVIKCVFWGGPVTQENAKNTGQWRSKFQVVMAGSNGYVNYARAAIDGYNKPTYLDNVAINAPLDCAGDDTYMGVRIFTSGPFDPGLCASACSATSKYNIEHPPASGKPQTCQFFNTYLLLKNGVSVGQYCAMYSQSWDSSYAKNDGQWAGSDHYTITFSYTYVNSTSPGAPKIPCEVASATSAIVSASLQPFCSSLLGYTTPLTTSTATAYATVPSSTVTVTTYSSTATAVTTTTQLIATTQIRKRDLPAITKSCADDHTHDFKARDVATDNSDVPLTTIYGNGWVDVAPVFTDAPNATATVARRDTLATPSLLTAFAASVVSSACSLKATPVTVTSTISSTTTQTITSGIYTVTSTAQVTTTSSTKTVTSTTTIQVAQGAPTGTIGYMKFVPSVNNNAFYALSDNANHLTDNYYRPDLRETFIVTSDGYLYSVTNNAYYYYPSGTYSLLYWSNSKSVGQAIFEAGQTEADGSYKVKIKNGSGGYRSICLYTNNGNTAAGQHVLAFSGTTIPVSNCYATEMYIYPAA